MVKEARARININNLLQEAEWRFFDSQEGPANITLENAVRITRTCLDTAFKNNDQLKTNTALQMEAEKIEFKVI